MRPSTIHADTQGQSLPVLSLAHLLGFELMPRIRNWKDLNFYRPAEQAAYVHIDALFGEPGQNVIDFGLIETRFRDLMRVAVSVREGRLSSSSLLLRRLRSGSRRNAHYTAFREVGRVVRTVQLLKYLTDPAMRRRVTAATDKVGAFNSDGPPGRVQVAESSTWPFPRLVPDSQIGQFCTRFDRERSISVGLAIFDSGVIDCLGSSLPGAQKPDRRLGGEKDTICLAVASVVGAAGVKISRFANQPGKSVSGRSRRTGTVVLILLISSVVAALLLARRYALGVEQTLAAALLGGGAPAGLYLAWVSYRDAQRSAPMGLPEIADQLAVAVGTQWIEEAAIRRLNDPWPLPVSWVPADVSLADDWGVLQRQAEGGVGWPSPPPPGTWAGSPSELAGAGGELAHVLTRVPTGRLVVLGGAGSGKSMLMVRLVLDLLAQRVRGGPVPVLFSLASWNPEKQDLRGWLSAQMAIDHPALAAAAAAGLPGQASIDALLEAGLVLPVLDGLDEVPDAFRGPAIARISDSDVLRGGRQVVLTCRTKQYRDVMRTGHGVRPSMRAGVIELRPLDASAISRYLLDDGAGGPDSAARWAPVLAALSTTAPVAKALARPLMVSLASAIYSPRPGELAGELRDPAELCDPALADQSAVEARLFDAFIPAAYRSPAPGRHRHRSWTARQAAAWLTLLAVHLDQDQSSNLAWWQLNRSLSRRTTGLAAGCASFLIFGLAGWIAGGRIYGVGYGLAYGLAFGVAGYVSIVFGSVLPMFQVEFRFRDSALKFLTRFAVGVALGVALAAGNGQPADLPGGIAVGCVLGAYGWLSTPSLARTIPSPSGTLGQDRAGALGFSIAVAVALGGLGGLDVAGSYPVSNPGGIAGSLPEVSAAAAICAIAGMYFGRLEYGRAGAVTYGIAGGVVGLLATGWNPPVSGPGPGLAFGLAFGIGTGMAAAAPRAWGRFLQYRIFMALRGELPWRLMSFLDDAHRRGVLRQVGAVYQFRHIELQKRLTSRPPDEHVT